MQDLTVSSRGTGSWRLMRRKGVILRTWASKLRNWDYMFPVSLGFGQALMSVVKSSRIDWRNTEIAYAWFPKLVAKTFR